MNLRSKLSFFYSFVQKYRGKSYFDTKTWTEICHILSILYVFGHKLGIVTAHLKLSITNNKEPNDTTQITLVPIKKVAFDRGRGQIRRVNPYYMGIILVITKLIHFRPISMSFARKITKSRLHVMVLNFDFLGLFWRGNGILAWPPSMPLRVDVRCLETQPKSWPTWWKF